ncbi:MAG: hypothetical protein IBX62_06025 [Coriobacteriia bacterium]|nr:hypothetical protein [Coriobacteriia bacterium]
MPDPLGTWLAVVRRQWWVVALTIVVAVAVGYASSLVADEPEPEYEGRARIVVEPKTLGKYYRLPQVDELLTDVSSEQFATRTAVETGIDERHLEAGLRVFSLKNPQTALVVAYRSSESSEALQVADEVAKRVVKRALALGQKEVDQTKREIRLTEKAIRQIEAMSIVADQSLRRPERAAAARDLWEMNLQLESLRDGLEKIMSAYSYSGGATVAQLPVIERRASGVAGAALAGLAAGMAVAAVREAYFRRRAPDEAA